MRPKQIIPIFAGRTARDVPSATRKNHHRTRNLLGLSRMELLIVCLGPGEIPGFMLRRCKIRRIEWKIKTTMPEAAIDGGHPGAQ